MQPTVSLVITAGAVLCGTAAGSLAQDAQPQLRIEAELEILESMLHRILAQAQGPGQETIYRIDPWPARISHGWPPTQAEYHELAPSEIEARVELIESLEFTAERTLPVRSGCSSLLTPPQFRESSGCPEQRELDFLFDLAEPAEAEGEWVLRVAAILHGRGGRQASTSDVFLTRTPDGWVVDRVITRAIWE